MIKKIYQLLKGQSGCFRIGTDKIKFFYVPRLEMQQIFRMNHGNELPLMDIIIHIKTCFHVLRLK